MSTFNGHVEQYPMVSIDRFDGKNLYSRAFFLSHAHTDHMVGLKSSSLLSRLNSSKDAFIYCSPVTKQLLESNKDIAALMKYMRALTVEEAHVCTIPGCGAEQTCNITVTLIPAGHCPGSVMFLLEGTGGRVLYTGDYRLSVSEISCISQLHSGTRVKQLDALYIDTTFCTSTARYIPTREASLQAAVDVCTQWLTSSKDHIVALKCKASIGYEHLISGLCCAFDAKVHTADWRLKRYGTLQSITDSLSVSDTSSRIHFCSYKTCSVMRETKRRRILTLIPSTMWFQHTVSLDKLTVRLPGNRQRLCYCFHASQSEVRDFVKYFKPARVYPNVLPLNTDSIELQKELNEWRTAYQEQEEDCKPVMLGALKVRKRSRPDSLSESSLLLGSPPTKVSSMSSSYESYLTGESLEKHQDYVNSEPCSVEDNSNPIYMSDSSSDGDSFKYSSDGGNEAPNVQEQSSAPKYNENSATNPVMTDADACIKQPSSPGNKQEEESNFSEQNVCSEPDSQKDMFESSSDEEVSNSGLKISTQPEYKDEADSSQTKLENEVDNFTGLKMLRELKDATDGSQSLIYGTSEFNSLKCNSTESPEAAPAESTKSQLRTDVSNNLCEEIDSSPELIILKKSGIASTSANVVSLPNSKDSSVTIDLTLTEPTGPIALSDKIRRNSGVWLEKRQVMSENPIVLSDED